MTTIKQWNGSSWETIVVGKQGPQGVQGQQGIQGIQGIQGESVVNPTLSVICTKHSSSTNVLYYGAGSVSPTATQVSTGEAFTVNSSGTLSEIYIRCFTASAGSTLRVGIYNCDSTTLVPTTLIADYGTIAGDTIGVKSITGLTTTITAGTFYRIAVVGGSTNFIAYGLSGGTGGQNAQKLLARNNIPSSFDNLARGLGYTYTPTTNSQFVSSPTWTAQVGAAWVNTGLLIS